LQSTAGDFVVGFHDDRIGGRQVEIVVKKLGNQLVGFRFSCAVSQVG
jgi:hypothetical protein